jgi:hypothetical protein
MTGRPVAALLRATWSAKVDLPSPWGPARRTSDPARIPPPMIGSRPPNPVFHTRPAALRPVSMRSSLRASEAPTVMSWWSTRPWNQ